MSKQSPFSFLETTFQSFSARFKPPQWAVDEGQRRIVLLINHVLLQEKEATSRLARQKGSTVQLHWREFEFKWKATPAGLLEVADPSAVPDLSITLSQNSPFGILQDTLRGQKPAVQIQGDVQLAAEVNWLVDHLRWDLEEDLSKIVGDAPAHGLCQMARRVMEALRKFLSSRVPAPGTSVSL